MSEATRETAHGRRGMHRRRITAPHRHSPPSQALQVTIQPMLSLLNIKQCLLAFKCDTSSPLINIHPLKGKFWSQPVTLLWRGRVHAVLVYLASDSIKKQHVTFFTPQITFPCFTHVFFWPQIQTNINNKSQPRPSMPKSHSPKKAMLGGQVQIWQSSFCSFEVIKH